MCPQEPATCPCPQPEEFSPYPHIRFLCCRSQWPRGLRRRSSAARLLRLWVRIPPGAWMFVCCECCVLSGRGLCDGLITRPEGFYRLWRVIKTMRKQVKINRSNRWATPEVTIPLAKKLSQSKNG